MGFIEEDMSLQDQMLCSRIARITRGKKMPQRSKDRLLTLLRTTGFRFAWKGLASKAAAIN